MTKQVKRGSRKTTSVGSSLRDLVEAVVETVVARMQKTLPTREEVRAIQREVTRLGRKLGTLPAGKHRRVGRPRLHRVCKVPGCNEPHVAQGLCSKHYQAARRKRIREEALSRKAARKKAAGRKKTGGRKRSAASS